MPVENVHATVMSIPGGFGPSRNTSCILPLPLRPTTFSPNSYSCLNIPHRRTNASITCMQFPSSALAPSARLRKAPERIQVAASADTTGCELTTLSQCAYFAKILKVVPSLPATVRPHGARLSRPSSPPSTNSRSLWSVSFELDLSAK